MAYPACGGHFCEDRSVSELTPSPKTIDQTALDALWNFADPKLSAQRFREAVADTEYSEEARAELATQLARALGLAGDYDDGDAVLNALLFALIGMELLLLPFSWLHLLAASLLALAILLSRLLTVAPAILLLRRWRTVPRGTIRVLTWGGLRGGVSVALALALPLGPERDLLLSITYIVVLSSILLQGLSIGKLVRHVTNDAPAPASKADVH